MTAPRANGLISALDAEWMHFVWTWGIVALVSALALGGVRGRWQWLLLLWFVAHAGEIALLALAAHAHLARQ